jgi:hypothetical protein
MKRTDAILTVAVGLGLFAFVASRIGWNGLLHQLKLASLAVPVLVSISFVTQAWRIALHQGGFTQCFGKDYGLLFRHRSRPPQSTRWPMVRSRLEVLGPLFSRVSASGLAIPNRVVLRCLDAGHAGAPKVFPVSIRDPRNACAATAGGLAVHRLHAPVRPPPARRVCDGRAFGRPLADLASPGD